jgi:hypothetical protein
MSKTARNLALAISTCAMCAISSPGFAAVNSFLYFPYLDANDDSYTTLENTTLTVVAPGVLSNDSWNAKDGAPAADLLGYPTVLTNPTVGGFCKIDIGLCNPGTLSLNSDGSFTYTPALNFTGTVTFTYEDVYTDNAIFCDILGFSYGGCGSAIALASNVATVTIDVVAPTTTPLPATLPLFASGLGGLYHFHNGLNRDLEGEEMA